MKHVMVRYRVKQERVAEHEELVRAVFRELAERAPTGLRYGAYKQPDGVSFVHVASIEGATNPLDAVAAFKAFTANIRERCDEAPVAVDLGPIGTYAA